MYRSDDAAASWKGISKGLPSRFGFPIVTHPHESGTIYVVPENGAERRYVPGGQFRVWRSRNGGKTWQALSRGLPQKHAYIHVMRQAAGADTLDVPGIYVGTVGGELFYSPNEGSSWKLMHNHLPAILSVAVSVV